MAKFAETETDKKEVLEYFDESAKSSLLFGGALSYALKSIWPLAGSAVTVLYYKGLYNKALNKASINPIDKAVKLYGLNRVIDNVSRNGSVEDIKAMNEYLLRRGR